MMDENYFWAIIATSREAAKRRKRSVTQDFLGPHMEELAKALRQLPPEEIVAFDRRFSSYRDLAYRWDVWGAAYWLGGGCGDDGFLDFSSCLISLGKDLFFQVLGDPDALADIADRPDVPYLQAEGFQYVAMRVYKEKTGEDMPQPEVERRRAKPKGRLFDFDNEELMRRHYPKLVAKFPEMGD